MKKKEFYLKLASKEKYKAKKNWRDRLIVDIMRGCFYLMEKPHLQSKVKI